MKPKIGIIGTGQTVGIAHFHALGILADGRAEISAVYDRRPEGAAHFCREHGLAAARVCTSSAELLDQVDAVIICTPNATHLEYLLQALAAQKSVLVEKPLALSAAESRRALGAAAGQGGVQRVGFVYRYANAIQRLRRLVQDELGPVYTFSGWFGGRRLAQPGLPLEWRMIRGISGSGALGDFGSHLVDLATYVAGLRFESVAGMTSTVIPTRPADAAGLTQVENDDQAALLGRAGVALATFTVSRVGMDDLTLLAAGPGGMARLSMGVQQDGAEVLHYLPAASGAYSTEWQTVAVAPQPRFEGWFVAQAHAFIDSLLGEADPAAPVPDLAQGHYVESVLAAAERAAGGQFEEVTL
jgi:predicted dehydrogenase